MQPDEYTQPEEAQGSDDEDEGPINLRTTRSGRRVKTYREDDDGSDDEVIAPTRSSRRGVTSKSMGDVSSARVDPGQNYQLTVPSFALSRSSSSTMKKTSLTVNMGILAKRVKPEGDFRGVALVSLPSLTSASRSQEGVLDAEHQCWTMTTTWKKK